MNATRMIFTTRHTPEGVLSMPAFGSAYPNTEIAELNRHESGP